MIGDIIKDILDAEKQADDIKRDADSAVRRVEKKTQQDIQKFQEQSAREVTEQIALSSAEADVTENLNKSKGSRQNTQEIVPEKITEAIKFIVSQILSKEGGAE